MKTNLNIKIHSYLFDRSDLEAYSNIMDCSARKNEQYKSNFVFWKLFSFLAFFFLYFCLLPLFHSIHAQTIDHVDINISSISATLTSPPIGLSALAYDNLGDPIWSGVAYLWGISSSNSIGTLSPTNDTISNFQALDGGTGDLWVQATYASVTVTKSIAVTVTQNPIYVRTDGSDDPLVCNGTENVVSGGSSRNCAYLTIDHALTRIADNGTIYVGEGTFAETLTIAKPLTLKGSGKSLSYIKRASTGGASVTINYSGSSVNKVIIDGFDISPATGATAGDYALALVTGTDYFTLRNSTITSVGEATRGVLLDGEYNSIDFINNTFQFDSNTASGDVAIDFFPTGNDLQSSQISILQNTFTSSSESTNFPPRALSLGSVQYATISGNIVGSKMDIIATDVNNSSGITIANNNFKPTNSPSFHIGGLYIGPKNGGSSSTLSNITITNNIFNSNEYGIVFDAGFTADRIDESTISISYNSFIDNSYDSNSLTYNTYGLYVGFVPTSGFVKAENNYWNSTNGPNSTGGDKVTDYVDYDPHYRNSSMSILSNGTRTGIIGFSTLPGQTQIPSNVHNIFIDKLSVLNLASGISSTSSGNITIAGNNYTLSNYTHGQLTSINLSQSQTIGDTVVNIAKAVQIDSGIDGTSITLSTVNSGTEFLVSIPDETTVLAPSGWDGMIHPIVSYTTTSSDILPTGYTIATHVATVGSSVGLLFDKAVTISITGANGYFGYKPEGSNNWVRITSKCGGTYSSPTIPTYPGQCYITNGNDGKILTYHFSTFGTLNNIEEARINALSSGSSSQTSSACSDSKPDGVPDFFEVRMKRNKAVLLYTTVKKNVTGYYIVYGNKIGLEQYGMSFSAAPGFGEMTAIEIGYLKANTPYYFKMMAVNNCMPGVWSGWLGGKTARTAYGELRYYKYNYSRK